MSEQGLPLHDEALWSLDELPKVFTESVCSYAKIMQSGWRHDCTSRDARALVVEVERQVLAEFRTRIEAIIYKGNHAQLQTALRALLDEMKGQEHANERPPAFTDHPQDIADQEAANWDNAQEHAPQADDD